MQKGNTANAFLLILERYGALCIFAEIEIGMQPKFLGSIMDLLQQALSVGVLGFIFMLVYEPFDLAELYGEYGVSEWFIYAVFSALVSIWIFILGFVYRRLKPRESYSIQDFLLFASITVFSLSIILFAIHEPVSQIPTAGWTDYFTVLRYTFLVLIVPFFILGIFYFRKGASHPEPTGDLIHIKDDQDRIKLSVKPEDVLYFESTDNYVSVYMTTTDEVRKQLVRTTLKKLKSEVPSGHFLRCSRSIVVNKGNISAVEQKAGNVILRIHLLDYPIRVSRGMKKEVLAAIEGQTNYPK